MPRPMPSTLRRLFIVSTLALLGARFSDARAGTVPPAHPHRQPPPSLLAHSRHRLYIDQKALRDRFYQDGAGYDVSFCLDGFTGSNEALINTNYADGAFDSVFRLSLTTGRVWRDHKLNDAMRNKDGNDGDLKPIRWAITSDRNWLLWKDAELSRLYTIVATPLSRSRPYPRTHSVRWDLKTTDAENVRTAEIAWFPGTHRWMELWSADRDLPTEAHIYDLDKPGLVKQIPIAPAHAGRRLAGITPEGTVVTASYLDARGTDAPTGEVAVTTFRLDTPRQTRQRIVVHAPAGGLVRGLRLSPDGRTIAWLMVSGKNHDTLTVGTTDATGAHWREIGEASRPHADEESGGAYLAGWLPDSRSFFVCLSATDLKRGRDDLRQISVR